MNGFVLVMVLRLLTMVVIRRVPNRSDEAVAPIPVAASAHSMPASEPEPELVAAGAAAAAVSESAIAPRGRVGNGRRGGANGPLYRIHHHRMLLGVPVLAAIFASGAWLGDSVGGQSSADAATVTVHLRGKIIRIAGAPVAVRVPATTVTTQGHVVSVPATTVQLPPQTQTVVNTINNTTTDTTMITTTVSIPTTTTETATDTTTVTETTTITTATTSAPTT
ncbi:MAG: hypothetical protein ACRDQE_15635 [Gaiellales bacterium]